MKVRLKPDPRRPVEAGHEETMTNQTATPTHPLEPLMDAAFERRADISPSTADPALLKALDEIIGGLNDGQLRVAEKRDGTWVTNQWIKKAVLLYFRTHDNA